MLSDGPRVYETGGRVGHIPEWKQLDFSLGITAFDNRWAGPLSSGDYDKEVEVDFTRFYTYSGNNLNTNPQWNDEFNGSSLDFGKWYTANWSFAATQFKQENVQVRDGSLFVKVNRTGSGSSDRVENLAPICIASQSSTAHSGVASRAIDGNSSGNYRNNSVTHTSSNKNAAWWQVRLSANSTIEQIIIHNRSDSCCFSRLSNYTVSVLDDRGNTVWSDYYSDAPTTRNVISLAAIGRTVRVSLDGVLSLAEVEVMGIER